MGPRTGSGRISEHLFMARHDMRTIQNTSQSVQLCALMLVQSHNLARARASGSRRAGRNELPRGSQASVVANG
ncbi:hypothetical protein VTI74DRAFT_4186 [Chaetomium olivicolor]